MPPRRAESPSAKRVNAVRPKLDLPNCLAILRACHQRPRTARELQKLTGLSRASVFRTLRDLREQLGVDIAAQEDGFAVSDTGLIDSRRLQVTTCPRSRDQSPT